MMFHFGLIDEGKNQSDNEKPVVLVLSGHEILYFFVSAAKVIMCCLIAQVRSISFTFFSSI